MRSDRRLLTAADVVAAADWAAGVLSGVPEEAWSARIGDAADAWTARRGLDHIVDALLFHAVLVARRSDDRGTPPRNGDPAATARELTEAVVGAAAVHADVLRALRPGETAFHPAGRADREGWIGMACTEILVHTADIAAATGTSSYEAPSELAGAVVDRVLPWTPVDDDGWARLLYATGRRALGSMPAASADWWWQAAPLDRWAGTPRRRTAPPQW
jgi:hypothetical protein